MVGKKSLRILIAVFFVINFFLIALLSKGVTFSKLLGNTTGTTLVQNVVLDSLDTILIPAIDSSKFLKPVGFETIESKAIPTGIGVKSILFNKKQSKLYSINLEAMNVYEFDRASRKIKRKLVFDKTAAKGYNYQKREWFESFEEKPVEACFSHNEKYLWVSLHNGNGVVAWNLRGKNNFSDSLSRSVTIKEGEKETKSKVKFIKTGKTPKVLTRSLDNKYLFVANWHSHTISVVKIKSRNPKYWRVVDSLKVRGIPRGMAVNEKHLYVGIMSSDIVSVFDVKTLKFLYNIKVGRTPRHLILDDTTLYVSLSSKEKIIKVNIDSCQVTKSVTTKDDPRTIFLSKDKRFVYATCYGDGYMQAFRAEDLKLIGSFSSNGKPIAVASYHQNDTIEAWVANHRASTLKVFTLKVKYGIEDEKKEREKEIPLVIDKKEKVI